MIKVSALSLPIALSIEFKVSVFVPSFVVEFTKFTVAPVAVVFK